MSDYTKIATRLSRKFSENIHIKFDRSEQIYILRDEDQEDCEYWIGDATDSYEELLATAYELASEYFRG